MAQVSGIGTTWNLPNYAGELFTADPTQTPFLSMIGGLTGGRQTDNFEFPTAVLYDFPEAGQPEISEQASVTARQLPILQGSRKRTWFRFIRKLLI